MDVTYRTMKIYTSPVIIYISILVAVVAAAYLISIARIIPCIPTRVIEVGSKSIPVCIASTTHQQTQGLSSSYYLPKDWGMLFVFDDYSHHRFWMKDMRYDIDILWLDDDYSVTEAARNASPDTYPGLYSPVYANRFVLETRPGLIDGEFPTVSVVKQAIPK